MQMWAHRFQRTITRCIPTRFSEPLDFQNNLMLFSILEAIRVSGETIGKFFDLFLNFTLSKFRDRYHEQVTVWLDEEATQGAIAPSIVPVCLFSINTFA